MARNRPVNLRQVAATIFGLTAILPILLFLFFLWHYDLVRETEAQVGLLLALLVAMLGFVLFQRMVDRIADFAHTLAGAGTPSAQDASSHTAVGTVPGIGPVSEIGEIAQAFSRMLEELRASTERLEDLVFKLGTLNEMVETTAKIPQIQDLLAHVLERTMRAVRAGIGSVMLLDRDRQRLRVAVARGFPTDAPTQMELAVGEGIAGRVVQNGEAVLVEDIETDPRFARANDPKYGGGSFICLPLRVQDRVIGVVNLARKQYAAGRAPGTPAFSQTDLQFLNALMTYTAYAVDNARLLEEAQRGAQRLKEVVEDQQVRLTVAQQQMVQAAKLSALGELVAGVAHELNNPLTVILGTVEVLSEDAPETLRPRLQFMQGSVDRARRTVQSLLTFARRAPIERKRVDLSDLLDKVLAITGPELRLFHVTVQKRVESGLPAVWADAAQLQQVLLNLVTNAKQALAGVDGERRLSISMRQGGPDEIEIAVEDSGPGIPADLLPRVFDPFVSTKGPHGTGLGLSISYGIVREHGGQISVERVAPHGARFVIDLPVGAPSTADAAPAAAAATELAGRRVLVVEDDESVRDILRRHLEHAGCQAVTVGSAEEALKRLADGVHLVVSDFFLPGMNGLALYREVVARVPDQARRFLFLTAGLIQEETQAFLSQANARLLQKPFTRQQFLGALREVLG
jgi:signal transduction histidine kinase/HAMP domain-containing protein